MAGPLEGIRVLDLSRVVAGPYCTMVLGDLGADVIKVEQPGSGDDTRRWGPPWAGGESAYYLAINRNKRDITLNLKDERAKEIVRELARQSDIVVENFRVGALDRMGLGYSALSALNPRLIWCSVTGYGQDGPYANRAGYDFVAQGEGGLMSITGEPDGEPMKVGIAISDVTTGLFATIAILGALHARKETGVGQQIDAALLPSTAAVLINLGSGYLLSGELPKRYGNAHANVAPYQTFQARDEWFIVAVGNDRQFRILCEVMDLQHLPEDERFATNPQRLANREALTEILQGVFITRDAADWLQVISDAGIACGPINTLDRVFSHPQILHRNMVPEVDHPTAGRIKLAGIPYILSGTPAEVRLPPPTMGQHTDEVLREYLNFSEEEIARLRADGVV